MDQTINNEEYDDNTEQVHETIEESVQKHASTVPDTETDMESMEKGFDEMDEIPKEPEPKKPELRNDVSELIQDVVGGVSEAMNELLKYAFTETQLEQIKSDPEHPVSKIGKVISKYTRRMSYNQGLVNKMVTDEASDFVHANSPEFPLIKNKFTRGKKFEKDGMVLEGDEAIDNTIARIEGFKKINLEHSGFWICIRKLSNDEIRNILNYVDEDKRQTGKILGNYYYLMENILFVEAIMNMLPFIVTDSNLKNFRGGTNLAKAISILDYETILCGIVSLMYKEGIFYSLVCPEKSCGYFEKVLLDLEELKIINNKKFPENALTILLSPEEFNVTKYKNYEKIINLKRILTLDDPKMNIFLKVPTLFTFVKHGKFFLAQLIKNVYENDGTFDLDNVKYYKRINYFKNFTPWIEKIQFLKEDGKVDFETTEFKAIVKLLGSDIWEENTEKAKELKKFFSDVRFVHYAYVGKSCPKCGRLPDQSAKGYIAVDMEDFFFTLSAHKLMKLLSAD